MRSLASFGTITRFSRIFGLVRVHMESTRAIALAFARDTRQVVQRFPHIIRPILAIRLSRRKRSLCLDLSRHFLHSRLVNRRILAIFRSAFIRVCSSRIRSIQAFFILFHFVLFGSFVSVWVARLFVSKDRLFHAFHCQNNLSSVVSSTQDFVALNCFQPRMTLISASCCERVYVSFSAVLLASTTKRSRVQKCRHNDSDKKKIKTGNGSILFTRRNLMDFDTRPFCNPLVSVFCTMYLYVAYIFPVRCPRQERRERRWLLRCMY